jgi:hypothetical protein
MVFFSPWTWAGDEFSPQWEKERVQGNKEDGTCVSVELREDPYLCNLMRGARPTQTHIHTSKNMKKGIHHIASHYIHPSISKVMG